MILTRIIIKKVFTGREGLRCKSKYKMFRLLSFLNFDNKPLQNEMERFYFENFNLQSQKSKNSILGYLIDF